MPTRLLLCFALCVCACGGASDSDSVNVDGGGADAASASFDQCEGACQEHDVSAVFTASTGDFPFAYFGLNAPAVSDSGDWEIYIELAGGGDGQCPSPDAPTPDRLFIISGLPVVAEASTTTAGTYTVLDFDGALLPDGIMTQATTHSAMAVAANPCVECAGGALPIGDRFVAYDITAEFAEGTASGHIFATHCDSLDVLE